MKISRMLLFSVTVFAAAWLPQSLLAQPFMIRGEIAGGMDSPVYLAAWDGDHFVITDSIASGADPFVFVLPGDTPPGVFRLFYDELDGEVLSKDRFVELIFNREDLDLYVERNKRGPVPHFGGSMENAVYQEFVDFQLKYEKELSSAYRAMFPHPAKEGDSAHRAALARYEALQEDRLRFMDSLTVLYPGLYAIRIMNAFRVPVIPGRLSHRERLDTLKQVFFSLAPIDDPGLLQAPVYTFRIVDFLSIFQDPSLDAEGQAEAFKRAVDLLMANVGEDEELRSFVAGFLMEGFELLGLEAVQIHLADHYLDEQCTTDLEELVSERMEACRAMQAGQQAPDLVLRDRQGRSIRLSSLEKDHVLVLYWSTGCPHCMEMMPQLIRWYREDNPLGVEVVSISIDSLEADYEDFLAGHPLPWISARDPLGWGGSLAGAYHIYATPSMFLLDGDLNIISRPLNMRQLIRAVRKLED